MNKSIFSNFNKKLFLIICDLTIIIISVFFAYSLRLEKIYPILEINLLVYTIFLTVIFFIFYLTNIYQILIRYLDYYSLKKISKSIFFCSLIIVPLNFALYEILYFPRSISFIALILLGVLILFSRIFINFLINLKFKNEKNSNNVLVVGIDDYILEIIKSIRQNKGYGNIIAIIDTSGKYKKRELNGIKIFKKEDLKKIIIENFISEIIIGYKSLKKKEISDIFNLSDKYNIRIKNLSNTQVDFSNLIENTLTPHINFFDIINRPKIKVEQRILRSKIFNKTILVTGGGGSIGSELCMEIRKHNPKKLYILENSEINLFNISNKINKFKNQNKISINPILGDCNDFLFLKNKFLNIKIDQIYHAAAYKHVYFGENNPYSMIKNNIFGSKSIIQFAIFKKVQNFIFISSDKAVNPKSILGLTKKIGEKLIKFFYEKNKHSINTKFTIVRFGNVIGSSGSVIPIFINQVANKRAVTVTNKYAKRYFMSISEAVQLVINASQLHSKGVKVYALEMGSQIYILDIAKRIIKLSGNTLKDKKNISGDIEIKFTGLRKGEKLSEELSLGQKLIPTDHPKIMECNEKIDTKNMMRNLNRIENKLKKNKVSKDIFKNMNL